MNRIELESKPMGGIKKVIGPRMWKIVKAHGMKLIVMAVPLAVFLIYIAFFAVEKYRSESIYVIRDLATQQSLGVDLSLFGGGSFQLSAGFKDRRQLPAVHGYLQSCGPVVQPDRPIPQRKDRYPGPAYFSIPPQRIIWICFART